MYVFITLTCVVSGLVVFVFSVAAIYMVLVIMMLEVRITVSVKLMDWRGGVEHRCGIGYCIIFYK